MQEKYFYNHDLTGFNFDRVNKSTSQVLDHIFAQQNSATKMHMYAGSIPLDAQQSDFAQHNPLDLNEKPVTPRIWIGTQSTVQAHYDMSENIACVARGTWRFTLFPPSQIANMYVSPLENTMAGPQSSMVNISDSDFEQHPKFAQALQYAMTAELSAGDAIFIPSLWWHHV